MLCPDLAIRASQKAPLLKGRSRTNSAGPIGWEDGWRNQCACRGSQFLAHATYGEPGAVVGTAPWLFGIQEFDSVPSNGGQTVCQETIGGSSVESPSSDGSRLLATVLKGPRRHPCARGQRVSAERPALSVDLDDLYPADEAVEIRATLVNGEGDAVSGLSSRSKEVSRSSGTSKPTATGSASPDRTRSGGYRIEVGSRTSRSITPPPVHDVFVVAG